VSELFAYISTRSTADPFIPPVSGNQLRFERDVSDAFSALSGGHRIVGQISFFPVQRGVPMHLLCDGREVAKVSFPELYDYLRDTQGTPTDPDNFVLPNFVGEAAFAPAPAAEPETVNAGTVSTEVPPGASPDFYGDYDSGGQNFNVIP
jgi:hypothetical protein